VSIEATIFNVQKFSTEDGPGIRTTVFFKGCPMHCPWCHNPESIHFHPEVVWHSGRCLGDRGCIEVCLQEALHEGERGLEILRDRCDGCARCVAFCPSSALEIHGRTIEVEELFDLAARDMAFYNTSGGGVTLSGGEPLAQPQAVIALLRLLHEAGIHTAVDTCGGAAEDVFREALPYSSLVLLDIKTVDPEKHLAYTGVPFSRVARLVAILREAQTPLWVRTPVIPGYTDDEEKIRAVAAFVARELPQCERHDLLAFSNLCTAKYEQLDRPFALADTPLISSETMESLCAAAKEAGSVQAHWSGPIRTVMEEV
jgi:pyruvate formate lyase activating enzyme